MIVVRRIADDEGPLLQRMRLAALSDSPGGFATTMAQAESMPDEQWAATAAAHASSDDQATFLAEHDEEVVGVVGAFRTADAVATMVGLWAAPGHRDVGVGDALLGAVLEWSTATGVVQLRLWLVERNELARAFYEQRGFVPTGLSIPYEPDPRLLQVELVRPMPSTTPAGP